MSKHKDGDYIPLVWEQYTPDAYFVRGHIDFAEAKDIILAEECLDDNKLNGKPIRHAYARWSMQGDAPEGCSCVLKEYDTSGRGRFKVTVLSVYNPPKGNPK